MAETETLEQQEEAAPEQDNAQEQEAVEKSRVHPMDPDFLAFAMPLAFLVDAIDVILELTAVFVIPKLVGIAIDIFVLIILGTWIYIRTKRIDQAKQRVGSIRQQLKSGAAQRMQGPQQRLSRVAGRGPLRRVLTRVGIVMVGELIPFVGILPFWIIAVFSTLREK